MTVTKAQFDAALATFVTNYGTLSEDLATVGTNVAAMNAALTQFIADYNANPGSDFTNELATLSTIGTQLATDTASVVADSSSLSTDLANIATADPSA